MRPLYDHIVSMLPEDFPRMEHLCMTINHNVTCYPHRDRANIGDVLIMFLGDFEGESYIQSTGMCIRRNVCGTGMTGPV